MGRALKREVTAGWVATSLGLELRGSAEAKITRVDSVNDAGPGSLCFAKSSILAQGVGEGAVCLTSSEDAAQVSGAILVSTQPRLDFARALSTIEAAIGFVWSDAAPIVHPSARVGRNVVLGRGVQIGAESIINHNVVIADEVVIGARCVVGSCTVIGEVGFGFERDMQGRAIRLPHVGTVVIGNDVEVGALTTVCRGTLGDTVLRDGCKIDDHVHIAHNVDVGVDAFVIACAEVSGGVKIGPRAWVAPNASVLNQLTIGSDAVIGLGAVVVKSVPDRAIVVGNPAKPIAR